MPYAVSVDGGWRMVPGASYLAADETYSEAQPPEKPTGLHVWSGGAWVENLGLAKQAKAAELAGAYEVAMKAGFVSSALGSSHRYATDDDRKAVLAGAVASGQPRRYGCYQADANGSPVAGTFTMRPHTNAQLQQVLNDGAAQAEQHLANYLTKMAQVSAASTVSEATTVTW